MKKISLLAIAASAMLLAACGNSSKPAASADSTSTSADTTAQTAPTAQASDSEAPADAKELTSQLAACVAEKNPQKLAALLESAKAKASDMAKNNPEQAKQYVSELQKWVSSNSSTIKTLVASTTDNTVANTVATAIGAVTSINPTDVVNSVANAAKTDAKAIGEKFLQNAKAGAAEAVTNSKVGETVDKAIKTKEAIENAPSELKSKGQKEVNKAADKANKKINEAAEKANKKVNDAVNTATNKALKGLGL